ncbi:elastase-like serine protease [Syncephalis plumigaleata]|nr:elastase-like serine protease [Syncephalis plumigaleata]
MKLTLSIYAACIILPSLLLDAYIVKLRAGSDVTKFFAAHNGLIADTGKVHYTYKQESFQGFAGKLTAEQVATLKSDNSVEYIEPQQVMRIAVEHQSNPPSWGLPRISNRNAGNNQDYIYPSSAGAGTEIWVVDTGINANHEDFGGRARMMVSFIEGEAVTDLNGHGTHVAGTTAGNAYGVAKRARVYGVKVLSGGGQGTNAGVIAGIQYVVQNARRNKAVINMSLSGGRSRAVDDAVNAAVNAGIAVVVAAGNEQSDACGSSPAGADYAFTVAASNINNQEASFSNYGRCVNIYAPGVNIKSLWNSSNTATNTISGTSMASPHVAGVAALFMSDWNYNSIPDLYNDIINHSTKNVITNPSRDTVNQLVYNR